jgi:hypothetical protein
MLTCGLDAPCCRATFGRSLPATKQTRDLHACVMTDSPNSDPWFRLQSTYLIARTPDVSYTSGLHVFGATG